MDAADGVEAVEVFMNNYDQIDLVMLDMTYARVELRDPWL